MVILRQETLFLFNGAKAKFVPCWSILSYEPEEGPSLGLYTDMCAKKRFFEKLALAGIARGIRFGSTSRMGGTGRGTDPGIDGALVIEIPAAEGTVRRKGKKHGRISAGTGQIRPDGPICLCAMSVSQLFEFVRILSDSLSEFGLPAPAAHSADSITALRHYVPRPFQPQNGWDQFWENPPPPPLQLRMNLNGGGPNTTGKGQRGSGMTVVDLESEQMLKSVEEPKRTPNWLMKDKKDGGRSISPNNAAVVKQYQQQHKVNSLVKANELRQEALVIQQIAAEQQLPGAQEDNGSKSGDEIIGKRTFLQKMLAKKQERKKKVSVSSLSSSSSQQQQQVQKLEDDNYEITISGTKTYADAEVQTEQTLISGDLGERQKKNIVHVQIRRKEQEGDDEEEGDEHNNRSNCEVNNSDDGERKKSEEVLLTSSTEFGQEDNNNNSPSTTRRFYRMERTVVIGDGEGQEEEEQTASTQL